MEEKSVYFMHIGGQQIGPLNIEEMIPAGLTLETMVWRPGMDNWAPANTLPELTALLENPLPKKETVVIVEEVVKEEHEAYMPRREEYVHTNSYQPEPQPEPEPEPQQPRYSYHHDSRNYETPQWMEYSSKIPNHRIGTLPNGWTNWNAWAIVATIFGLMSCGFIPGILGIVGIVKSNSANEAARRGDPYCYKLNSAAKGWTIASFVLSFCIFIAFIALYIIFVGAAIALDDSASSFYYNY